MDTDSTAAQKTTTYHAQALARGLKILNALADTDSATLTLGELREVVELPKSSLIRILSVLEEYDFIRRVSDDGTDRAVGPAVVRLAEAYLASANAGSLIQPYLRELADSLGQTTNAAVLDGTSILHVCVEEPVRPLRYRSHVLRDYAHSTGLGKALLAWLDPAKLASHLPDEPFPARTSHTITSKEAFLEELDAVRDRGYSLDDEESDEGVRCVSVPILHNGHSIAAISISGAKGELSNPSLDAAAKQLSEAADQIAHDTSLVRALLATSG